MTQINVLELALRDPSRIAADLAGRTPIPRRTGLGPLARVRQPLGRSLVAT